MVSPLPKATILTAGHGRGSTSCARFVLFQGISKMPIVKNRFRGRIIWVQNSRSGGFILGRLFDGSQVFIHTSRVVSGTPARGASFVATLLPKQRGEKRRRAIEAVIQPANLSPPASPPESELGQRKQKQVNLSDPSLGQGVQKVHDRGISCQNE